MYCAYARFGGLQISGEFFSQSARFGEIKTYKRRGQPKICQNDIKKMQCVKVATISLILCFLGSCQAQVPEDLLKHMRQLSTAEFIDEFMRVPQIEVDGNNITGLQGQQLSSSGRIPPNTREELMRDVAQPDYCSPHLVTVPIPRDADPNVVIFPSCTLIERCSGCEGSEAEICVPKDSGREYVTKTVIVSRYSFGSSNILQNQERKNIIMEKHTDCEIKCKVGPQDCAAVHRRYDLETCRCICKNANMESSCNSPKRWDNSLCECVCPFVKNCDVRRYAFNTDTCRCERRSLSSASNLGLHSSANDLSETMDTRGLDNSTVERLRGLITDFDETTTEATTTTEAPTTTPIPTSPTTPAAICPDTHCGVFWKVAILANGRCGCEPEFDMFGSGRKRK